MARGADSAALALPATTTADVASHQARASVTIGLVAQLTAEARITSGGLLAVGALVSAILLSTAVLVRAAASGRRA